MTSTTTPKIAQNDNERCENKTEKGRRCLFVVHTDATAHKYVNRDKQHFSLSDVVPAGFSLVATEVKPEDKVKKQSNRTDTKPRDADQKRVDTEAKKNAEKNARANHTTKTEWEKIILSEYIVPPRAVDTVLDYLRRAASTGGTVSGKQLRYRKGTHASGNVRIQWAFLTKTK